MVLSAILRLTKRDKKREFDDISAEQEVANVGKEATGVNKKVKISDSLLGEANLVASPELTAPAAADVVDSITASLSAPTMGPAPEDKSSSASASPDEWLMVSSSLPSFAYNTDINEARIPPESFLALAASMESNKEPDAAAATGSEADDGMLPSRVQEEAKYPQELVTPVLTCLAQPQTTNGLSPLRFSPCEKPAYYPDLFDLKNTMGTMTASSPIQDENGTAVPSSPIYETALGCPDADTKEPGAENPYLSPEENEEEDSNDDLIPSTSEQTYQFSRWWWPSRRLLRGIPPPRCARCIATNVVKDNDDELATLYCFECGQYFCNACDECVHDDGAARDHRVEHLTNGVAGGDGDELSILLPLLDLAILAAVMLYVIRPLSLLTQQPLKVDYFMESVCPLVQHVKRAVFSLDHTLYPLLRAPLSGTWCDAEDALLKTFSDLWVRGILTQTDSFGLCIIKFPSMVGALLGYMAVLMVLFAVPYAMVATLLRWIERKLVPDWKLTRVLAHLIHLVSCVVWMPFGLLGWCCRLTALGLLLDQGTNSIAVDDSLKISPSTGPRKSPNGSSYTFVQWHPVQDVLDSMTRVSRVLGHFFRKARRAVIATLVTSVFYALTARIALLNMLPAQDGVHGLLYQHRVEPDVHQEQKENPHCFSIELVVHQLAERLGIELPDLTSLVGVEGQVLAKMQAVTEKEYWEDTLFYKIGMILIQRFGSWHWQVRAGVCFLLSLAVFAGLVRRIAIFCTMRRHPGYRRRLGGDGKQTVDDY